MIRISDLSMPLDYTAEDLKKAAARLLKIPLNQIRSCTLARQSVDARKKQEVHFNCSVLVALSGQEDAILKKSRCKKAVLASIPSFSVPRPGRLLHPPVVVGAGPAGLFAGLILARAGLAPIIVERGRPVDQRSQDVSQFFQSGCLNPNSNVQFGEGGAGAFSDGKLNTGTKDIRVRQVLEELAAAGAPEEILYQAKPHIGTDRLKPTVKNLRETIRSLGGQVLFETVLTGLILQNGGVQGVVLQTENEIRRLETNHVILALGHSARDTFQALWEQGIVMEAKPFSIGARIEHTQKLINTAQYGPFAGHPALGAADYKLAVHLTSGRGVYTFCMCPGGQVVAAASEPGGVVTNGMSLFARDGANANSALLVGVFPSDFGSDHPLAGIEFQRKLEQTAFSAGGGGYRAPAQLVGDFLKKQPSRCLGDVEPTYQPGVTLGSLDGCLPAFLTDAMRQGILLMDKRLKGFAQSGAVLTGVETRSSSPVRILRGEDLQAVGIRGLYPCGEGAGYAGGIVSAAVDGLKCGEQVIRSSRGEP